MIEYNERQIQSFLRITLFLRKTKRYNHLNRISFNIVPLWKYELLQSSVKLLETFLEASLWNPFQLFRRILNYVSSITKALTLQCWFQSRVQIKISCSLVRGVWGRFQFCHIVRRNHWSKPTGVLKHCREGETNCSFSICGGVSFWLHS